MGVLGDFAPVADFRRDTKPNKCVVVYAHGVPQLLGGEVDYDLSQLLSDFGVSLDGSTTLEGVDYPKRPDGVYIAKIKAVDDGPGDWPGSREVALTLSDVEAITKEQWVAWCSGDYPWPKEST